MHEESVLVKNAIKQAKKYQEQLKELSKKDIKDDELEVLKPQLPTWWDYELLCLFNGILNQYTFLNIVWINYWIVL
jgi:hypothetical protein